MTPRFHRTRILDSLTWSQPWVVYFEATFRYHSHLLPHLCSESFCGATPSGPWSVLSGRVSRSGSRSGTRDPSPLRGPATYCRRTPSVQPSPLQWPWRSPGTYRRPFPSASSFGSSIAPPSALWRGLTALCTWFWICPRLEEPRVIRAFPEEVAAWFTSEDVAVVIVRALGRNAEHRHLPHLPPLPCAAHGLAAPALHVGRAGIRRPPAPFWGPHFPLPFSSVCGGAPLDCCTRSRVQPRPPLRRLFSGAGLPCCVCLRPASFPGPLPRPRCPLHVREAGPADMLPPVPGRHPGLLSSGDAPPSRQTCMSSRLPAREADTAEMHQAGAAVADRSSSLRVQGGPSGLHFPPAAYLFIYDGPGLGPPHQPPRGGPRRHRMVGGIPAQLERAGFLPTAAHRRGGTTVCYRRGRGRAWHGVRSEMALRCMVNVLELFGMAVTGFADGHVYVPPRVACAPALLFPCPAEREFASCAHAGLPGY